MLKYQIKNEKVTANRAWIMSTAWATVKRRRAQGVVMAMSEALKLAWWSAKQEVGVQIQSHEYKIKIANLAKLGRSRLSEMANDIHNINRHTAADANRLYDINAAMFYA